MMLPAGDAAANDASGGPREVSENHQAESNNCQGVEPDRGQDVTVHQRVEHPHAAASRPVNAQKRFRWHTGMTPPGVVGSAISIATHAHPATAPTSSGEPRRSGNDVGRAANRESGRRSVEIGRDRGGGGDQDSVDHEHDDADADADAPVSPLLRAVG